MIVGDIVELKLPVLSGWAESEDEEDHCLIKAASRGIVYSTYKRPMGEEKTRNGISIIFENGGIESFEEEEKNFYLRKVGRVSNFTYEYKGQDKLKLDIPLFQQIFLSIENQAFQYELDNLLNELGILKSNNVC